VTAPMAGPLPIPPDFPIQWERPEDEQLFWFQDMMHNPTAVTPLTASIEGPSFTAGVGAALGRFYMPITQVRHTHFNHYTYLGAIPALGSAAELQARQERLIQQMGEILPALLPTFYEKHVPRIVEISRGLRERPRDELTLREAAREVGALPEIREELWDLHMQLNIPAMAGAFGLEDFLLNTLGPEAESKGRLMLQGFPNKSTETGHEFWKLARLALGDSTVAQTLMTTPASGLGPALEATPTGREFLAAWHSFLQTYGLRSGAFEFRDPSWLEDPTVPLNHLRGYLANDGGEDPLASQQRQAAERERLAAEIEGRLPADLRPVFRQVLAGAQTYLPIAEDHNFYIDQMSTVSFRWPILALGRKLAEAGLVDDPDDVFFLTIEEIEGIAAGANSDLRDRVRERRASFAHFSGVIPPEALGTPPPPEMPPDPLVTKFFGFGVTELSPDRRVLKGIASAAGTVRGPVKVVRTLAESGKLEPGDIMVCHMTMPAWTPLFATLGAVVADSGGVLSHCSIVAREYGIPCVTGTRIGTRTLRDGQTVTVDGNRGIVRID
jgi:phosphohistidine swiveling domain-containing protein